MFANHEHNNEPVSKIYKELSRCNRKKKPQQFNEIKWAKIWTDILPKKIDKHMTMLNIINLTEIQIKTTRRLTVIHPCSGIYDSARQRKKLPIHTTGIDLKCSLHSERRQTQRATSCMITFSWHWKMKTYRKENISGCKEIGWRMN